VRQALAVFILVVDGRQVASTTNLWRAGPCVAAVHTAVAALELDVYSSYLGAKGTATYAAHLRSGRGGPEHTTANHPAGDLPVERALDKLVLDHAFVVRQVVEQATLSVVELHVDERRLQAAAAAG
jgi:hypothetical protein